jgi:hypothetical protein
VASQEGLRSIELVLHSSATLEKVAVFNQGNRAFSANRLEEFKCPETAQDMLAKIIIDSLKDVELWLFGPALLHTWGTR